LLARLLYGTGMRIAEAMQLRTKDIDFAQRTVIVREERIESYAAAVFTTGLTRICRSSYWN
jgi:integrase